MIESQHRMSIKVFFSLINSLASAIEKGLIFPAMHDSNDLMRMVILLDEIVRCATISLAEYYGAMYKKMHNAALAEKNEKYVQSNVSIFFSDTKRFARSSCQRQMH